MATFWSEQFNAAPGTDVSNLGFTPLGNGGFARVSSANALEMRGGRVNLFNYTERMRDDNTTWAVFSYPAGATSSTTNSTLTMPDGSKNGAKFNYPAGAGSWSGLLQTQSFVAGQPYTVSVWAAVESGTGSFRLFGYDTQTTYTSPNLPLTTTPTRFSFTFTPAIGGTTNATAGVGQSSDGVARTVVFWGAQLEQASQVSAYRSVLSGTDTSQIWCKDNGSTDQLMVCDILPGSANTAFLPMAFRVNSISDFIGINYFGGRIRVVDSSNNVKLSLAAPTAPFRLSAQLVGNTITFYSGPVGGNTTTPVGNAAGQTLTGFSSTATKTGFGYLVYNNSQYTTISDNYSTGGGPSAITPVDSRSETRSDTFTYANMPAGSPEANPNWVENFDGNVGNILNKGFDNFGLSSGQAYDNTSINGVVSRTLGLIPARNQVQESNDLGISPWTLIGNATRTGYDPSVTFPYGTNDGMGISLGSGQLSGIRCGNQDTSPGVGNGTTVSMLVSCWVAAKAGTAKVRLALIGMNGNYANRFSNDFTVDTTPQLLTFFATAATISNHLSFYPAIVNSSTLDAANIVAWGMQFNGGLTNETALRAIPFEPHGSSKIATSLWTKPVSAARQYMECDYFGSRLSVDPNVTDVVPFALRIVDSQNFLGIKLGTDNGGTYLLAYTPAGYSRKLGYLPSTSCRIRVELDNTNLLVLVGPSGISGPTNQLFRADLPNNLYNGFLSAQKTGFGWKPGLTTSNLQGLLDTYESGEVTGASRTFIVPTKARSETSSDTSLPVTLVWHEEFDEAPGTPLVDLGFTFATSEDRFLPTLPFRATVGTQGRLTFESSTMPAAYWVKDIEDANHFIEFDLYSFPVVPYECPAIIRALDPEHWIGVWAESDSLVFGYRYGARNMVKLLSIPRTPADRNVLNFGSNNGGLRSLPVRIRMQATASQVSFYASPIGTWPATTWWQGREFGYILDKDEVPLLMTGTYTGVGRAGDIAAENISDNYFSGYTFPQPSKIYEYIDVSNGPNPFEGWVRGARSETRVEDFDDPNNPDGGQFSSDRSNAEGYRARSQTYEGPRPASGMIKVECVVDGGVAGRSETGVYNDPVDWIVVPSPVSYTKSDRMLATTDIVIVRECRSSTSSDEYHEDSTVDNLIKTRSETRMPAILPPPSIEVELVETKWYIDNYIYYVHDRYSASGRERLSDRYSPGIIYHSNSDTFSDTGYCNGVAIPQGYRARSGTRADVPVITPERFVFGIKARSETYSDSMDNPGVEPGTSYRPWLFT